MMMMMMLVGAKSCRQFRPHGTQGSIVTARCAKCFGKFLPRGPGAVWALTPRRVFIVSQATQRILLCDVDDDVADGDDNNGGVQVLLVDDLMLMMTMIILVIIIITIIIIMYYTIKNTAGPKKCDFESRPRSFRDQAKVYSIYIIVIYFFF